MKYKFLFSSKALNGLDIYMFLPMITLYYKYYVTLYIFLGAAYVYPYPCMNSICMCLHVDGTKVCKEYVYPGKY